MDSRWSEDRRAEAAGSRRAGPDRRSPAQIAAGAETGVRAGLAGVRLVLGGWWRLVEGRLDASDVNAKQARN